MKQIPLSQGKFAIVDDEDFDFLNQWKWFFNKGYASRNLKKEESNKRKCVYMHRVILNPADGKLSDHINGDKLDNRRSNLRECTVSQNQMNKKIDDRSRPKTSQYKGVFYSKHHKRWKSGIISNGKLQYIGVFKTELEAALAYNNAAKITFGEFARINEVI